jgi:protein-disulfide isomerase
MTALNRAVDERDWVRGPADAPVTLLEYGDFECPFCGQAFWELKRLEQASATKVRFAFRHFPLAQAHPHARLAAEAARRRAPGQVLGDARHVVHQPARAGALRPAGVRR